ncbi:hypothetical protein Ancab_024323 [Ancistrocladus abbreviatus]
MKSLFCLQHHCHRHSKIVLRYRSLTLKSYHQSSPRPTPTPTHLNTLLNKATQSQSIKHATQIHTQLIINSYTTFPFLLTNLITLYAKCGHVTKSIILFSKTPDDFKTIVSWTSLITQFSHHNMPTKALTFFNQMRSSGIYPNHFTFSAILPACASTLNPFHGKQIHSLINKHGFGGDVFVGSALVGMYAKCSDVMDALKVFDEMPERNLVSWNSMIVGMVENELYDQAVLKLKEVLKDPSVSPDEVTCSSVFSACANMGGGLDVGKQIHGIVVKRGLVTLAYVNNSLIDMYCKCGSFQAAVDLFRTIKVRDVVTWNVMIMGYVQNGSFEEACKYFMAMRSEGIWPDEVSFSTFLNASASLASLNQGILIHNEVIKTGFVANACIASALITMYAKCGSLVDAYRVFKDIKDRNVVCWTAVIAAFQQHGYASKVIEFFESMLQEGITPDHITFICVLSACGHTGQVEAGFAYFNSMKTNHNMDPGPEHHACMVDMLGRAGRLVEAKRFIESMPMKPDPSVWGALLGACRNHKNIEMGREVAETLFKIEPKNPGNYVILANMYTRSGKLKEADDIRRLMGVKGVRKEPGCSWIDIKDATFVFTVNDKSHPRTAEIYGLLRKLKELAKKKGYVAEIQYATNIVGENKEQSLWHHSEKLALAFGLLALPAGASIRIKKNLRTCGDCHTVMKFASEIFSREIILRDINRFHHFANGSCSCRDYW